MSTYNTTIYRDNSQAEIEDEIDVIVTYTYHKATKGSCDKYGAQLEPDEPEYVDIDSVVDANTKQPIELEEWETDEIAIAILDNVDFTPECD